MATIIRDIKLANVIDEADIVVLEHDAYGSFSSDQIDEGDPIRVLMKSPKWSTTPLNVEGRMFKISDEKNLAIFSCSKKYSEHLDPLMQFLPLLVSALLGTNNCTLGLDALRMHVPSTFRGVLALCVSVDLNQIESIARLFEPWEGTIYLINLREKV